MNFQPELAAKVMAGEKTVTRRHVSDNPRSPWSRERCSLKVGQTYAVCPGRGKHAIGRVRITSVRQQQLGMIGLDEAVREGFGTMHGFRQAWIGINGGYDPAALVWRVEFERVVDLAAVLTDVEAAVALLPEAERLEYERAQESVVNARRHAERHAHEVWVG